MLYFQSSGGSSEARWAHPLRTADASPDIANEPRRLHPSGANGAFPIPRRARFRGQPTAHVPQSLPEGDRRTKKCVLFEGRRLCYVQYAGGKARQSTEVFIMKIRNLFRRNNLSTRTQLIELLVRVSGDIAE